MSDERPPSSMTLAEVRAELKRVTGTPWSTDADGARRQALWRRLDQLIAEGAVSGPETPPAATKSNPPDILPRSSLDWTRVFCVFLLWKRQFPSRVEKVGLRPVPNNVPPGYP
jgi:hypothetical protein